MFARTRVMLAAAGLAVFFCTGVCLAHFQALLPATDSVSDPAVRQLGLRLVFTHPMEQGPAMNMARPEAFGVLVNGERQDLLPILKPTKVDGQTAFEATYSVRAPGDHVFHVTPAPYWEPAEGKWIIHYTKVVVDAYAAQEGWDALVGAPVEIEPLVRPYGVWAGNVFRGVVRRDGAPVPFATVEVEYWNEGKRVGIPHDAFVTQVIKADATGTFTYAMPRAGWWGFAALLDGDQPRPGPDGQPAPVELGALIWVRTVNME